MKRAVKLRLLTADAREKLAAELLNPDKVLAQAAAAASQGAECLRVAVEIPADLRATTAAKTLESLLRREGFEVAWESRVLPGKANLTGADVTVFELVLRWRD